MKTIGLLGGMSWESSVEYERIINQEARRRLGGEGATRLERAGAEVILLCTNTMHRVADAIERAVSVTFVHIADATAAAIDRAGIATVGLLGTRYTMEDGFYAGRLEQGRDLRVIVPVPEELNPRSRQAYIEVIGGLRAAGAQGVIAGCTDIE